jgi:hypothetical protein
MPALSKICPLCGYIEASENSHHTNPDDMIRQMEFHTQTLNKKQLTLGNVLNSLMWVVYIALTIQFVVMGIVFVSLFVLIMALLLFGLFCFSLIKQLRGKTKAAKAGLHCKLAMAELETLERQCLSYYGKDRSVSQHVNLMSELKDNANNRRRKNNLRQYLIGWFIIAAFVLVTGYIQYDFMKYVLDEEQNRSLTQVEASLKDNNYDDAIRIFLTQDMGKRGDYEKAMLIVNSLLEKSKKSEAAAFIEQCSALRYPSDKEKLKQLIK